MRARERGGHTALRSAFNKLYRKSARSRTAGLIVFISIQSFRKRDGVSVLFVCSQCVQWAGGWLWSADDNDSDCKGLK